MHSLPVEPAVVEFSHCLLCILSVPKFDIDVAHGVIPQVVAHAHLFSLPVLLLKSVNTSSKKLSECSCTPALLTWQWDPSAVGRVLWVPVQVAQRHGLADSQFIVKPEHGGPDLKKNN